VPAPKDHTWHWREWHAFGEDGTLTMKTSGWRADGTRWTGSFSCGTVDPDYPFWCWLLSDSGCTTDLIDDDELVATPEAR
jgi:hypothetical protein